MKLTKIISYSLFMGLVLGLTVPRAWGGKTKDSSQQTLKELANNPWPMFAFDPNATDAFSRAHVCICMEEEVVRDMPGTDDLIYVDSVEVEGDKGGYFSIELKCERKKDLRCIKLAVKEYVESYTIRED